MLHCFRCDARCRRLIEAQDVEMLRRIGWNDSDIFDAATLGVNMVAMGMLFNAFKMHEAC